MSYRIIRFHQISTSPGGQSKKGSRWKKHKSTAMTQRLAAGHAQSSDPGITHTNTDHGSTGMRRNKQWSRLKS